VRTLFGSLLSGTKPPLMTGPFFRKVWSFSVLLFPGFLRKLISDFWLVVW